MKDGSAVLIDVRPVDEYEYGHIPNSISIPISKLEQKLHSLPKDKEIIAYCRGPYCVFATEAVEILISNGYKALLLDAGINEWKQMEY
ncbi:rhodanese-like domain-containing protein [Bacillus alveayuensis]|uniref:rhodanese-like domain-containing protein n=1 Tax=Aeribacillus alveayuensis TaxID=279215 RepID=UPI000695FF30|nr:rhodanese-like domain-containing protein [Bacillus alveayuensis]